jgi:hypothetical protein
MFSKYSLHIRFSDRYFACISHFSHACYMTHPSHSPWFDQPNKNFWISVAIMSQTINKKIFLQIVNVKRTVLRKTNRGWNFTPHRSAAK